MDLMLYPSLLSGIIDVPPSKSFTHRALICASLANGKSMINNPLICKDTLATIHALKAIGIRFDFYENKIIVDGTKKISKEIIFDMEESASSFRMLLPILSCFLDEFKLLGSNKLFERVITEDLDSLTGLTISPTNNSLKISKKLDASNYYLSGKKTSQWISGMIMALPFLKNNPTIHITDTTFFSPYLNMTIKYCQYYGLDFIFNKEMTSISLKPNTCYLPKNSFIEGDFSNAAFWIAACYLNHNLKVSGLNFDSIQADKAILNDFRLMGVQFSDDPNNFHYVSGKIKNAEINIQDTPDLGPILAVIASLGTGRVVISGIEKLIYKESNRLEAVVSNIKKLGGNIQVENNSMIIDGKEFMNGGTEIDSFNDHRIAMAFSVVSSRYLKPVILKDFLCVEKSYLNFYDDLQKVNGKIEVIS